MDRELIGSLGVFWRGRERQLSEQDLRELEELAVAAAPVIENARRFREARQLADLDSLTSLHNRRYFHDALARECARATRYERSLALLVFDIDDFKSINDHEGHLGGDRVLAQLGDRVQTVIRSADLGCRIGGDEFAVILPESAPCGRRAALPSASVCGREPLHRTSGAFTHLRRGGGASTERRSDLVLRARRRRAL